MSHPTAFVSYSWDDDAHKSWVATRAGRLRADGVDAKLDKWEAVPGDQLPAFMERAIRTNNFVLIVCSPNYKQKSDARRGGVGYEGDIMAAEVLTRQNDRKFVPILARGGWEESSPSWIVGKYYVDMSSSGIYETGYKDLVATLTGQRTQAPPLGVPHKSGDSSRRPPTIEARATSLKTEEPVKIIGILIDEVTQPRMDGTPGCALYTVPFKLSRTPSSSWNRVFIEKWNRPHRFTSMHRPGIAKIAGDKVVLNGTTVDEIKKHHRDTLIMCVSDANAEIEQLTERLARQQAASLEEAKAHRKEVEDAARNIQF